MRDGRARLGPSRPTAARPLMSKSDWQVTAVLVLICCGILVLFTDVELRLVRWVNCSAFAPVSERGSAVCE
jgi:hypothetical protein